MSLQVKRLFVYFSLQLGILANRANLELFAVLLQHVLAVIFPESLAGILAGEALDDAGAAGVFVDKV